LNGVSFEEGKFIYNFADGEKLAADYVINVTGEMRDYRQSE